MSKKTKEVISYLAIIAGALLASFAVACLLLPNDAIDYGTAGIGIIISKLTGINLSVCVMAVFIPFILLGRVVLGVRFFFKALAGSAAYTIGLELFESMHVELNTEHFLAVIFGGAILGGGLSLILQFGGCIDGSEIFANILINRLVKKTGKTFSMFPILIAFNACVYIAVFLLINKNAAMMSLLVYVVATSVTDHFTDRFEAIKQITIITKNPTEIIKELKTEMNKTCTIINSSGAIAGENKMLICYINYLELSIVKGILSHHKGTFCTVSTIDEILK